MEDGGEGRVEKYKQKQKKELGRQVGTRHWEERSLPDQRRGRRGDKEGTRGARGARGARKRMKEGESAQKKRGKESG